MLKIKDTYINLKNVLYINTHISEPNCYNDFTKEFIIAFIFGENYSYNQTSYNDILGYPKIHENEKSKIIQKRFCFKNEEEFNEVLKEIEKRSDVKC